MFYTNLRNLAMGAIPGAGLANFIYLGMIMFIIAGLLTYRRWAPFAATFVFAAVVGVLDNVLLNIGTHTVLYNGLHMLILPLLVTFLYFGRR